MGHIRTVKPSFFTHEGLYDLERETGLPMRVRTLVDGDAITVCEGPEDRISRFRFPLRV